jgi:hypothetical protein
MAIWNILPTFGIFYDQLVHLMTVLCSFGTFFPVLVSCAKKNLATLRVTTLSPQRSAKWSLKRMVQNYFLLALSNKR